MSSTSATSTSPLASYAAFLLEYHLDDVAAANLRLSRDFGVPLLRLFESLPEDELQAMYRESMANFLADLVAGRALETAVESLERWERDEVPGLSRDQVEPSDMVLVYAAQKQALYDYLERYTSDVSAVVALVKAIGFHFTAVQNAALVVFDRLRQQAAARAVKAETEKQAAESTAEELAGLNEELSAQQEELNQLYEQLQRHSAGLDAEVARRTEELHALNSELAAQAEELEAHQAELQNAYEAVGDQIKFQFEVMNNIPGAVGYCDLDLVIRAANEPYVALVGKPLDQVIGRHAREVFPAEALPGIEALRDQLIATGEPVLQIGVPGQPDATGRETFMDHTITLVRRKDGTPAGMLSLSVEVTARVMLERTAEARGLELERQRRLLERVTGHAPAGIAFLDRGLIVRWANPELLRLFGRPADFFLDRHFLEAMPTGELRDRYEATLQKVLRAGEPYHALGSPYTMDRGKGPEETFWDVSYVPVPGDDGRAEGVLVFALEATDRVRFERTQHERIDQMRQLDQLKDDFLGALSSQLATPINTVLGFASVLDEGAVGGELKPEQHEYVRRILATCNVQLALVNDLLDLGRLSADKLALARYPLDLSKLADAVLTTLTPLTMQQSQRVITYLPDGLPQAVGDRSRVEQVLVNFIHTANRLTQPGGQIRVEVKHEGDRLRCEVQDGGKTLTDTQIDQAIERYAQLGGTWLGLSVSKRLIEKMGGELGITPRPGTGNAFWFTLPLAP